MKKVAFIVLLTWGCSAIVKAPEKPEKFSNPEYWTHGKNMVFRIYPDDYHSRKIQEILNNINTIK